MTERLGKKTVLREDFLSNISHEFKTPLSVINNYVTILQSGMLSEQESLEYMEKYALRRFSFPIWWGTFFRSAGWKTGRSLSAGQTLI